ncbi:MAG: ketoacid-CoA transferase [Desulfotalea sp.]|nr:MAG: ketoacid-CoA transferase [Desulfotalea sp.]
MTVKSEKLMALSSAIETFVTDGCHLSIGGFTVNRNPMGAVYEIIRQGRKKIHLYAHSNGQGVDELVGAGCVEKIEIAYAGNGRFAPTCIRFKRAVQNRSILVEDYSNYQMTLRFQAGAMGIPFLPTRSSLGTDIINKWGFSKKIRQEDPRIPDEKLIVGENPFKGWTDTKALVFVPAINPDVTIIHVQQADEHGTARIQGLTMADVEQAKAAKHLIVTCEELVSSDEMKSKPDTNQIPHFCVDAVVHLPWGAYPTACYNNYDYDPIFFNDYKIFASDDTLYQNYLDKFIHGTKNHQEFLDLIGGKRLQNIKADPRTGYAINLDRK